MGVKDAIYWHVYFVFKLQNTIIMYFDTAAKEVMSSPVSVCLSVSLTELPADSQLGEILWNGWT